jgi:glycosyltransferase involved in cell wall biosynthesis
MYNLTLSMIVKNEAPNIQRCLESVAPYIDYYIICDTGSTDNTKEIIKNFFDSKGIPGEILDHEWKHFGHNRSLALEACLGKTQWALMIDADDFISGAFPKDKLDTNFDGYIVKIKRGPFEWYRAQLFNVGKKKWWYEEPLHEYAICEQPLNIVRLEGDYAWEVRTEGCRAREAGGDDREKYRRDYEFLKKYLEEHPNNVRTQFYLAQSAFDAHMFDIAEKEYLKRTTQGGWVEEVFYSWMRVGICRELLEKPLSEVIDAFLMAHETLPIRAEPFWQMSCIYRKHNRNRNAFIMASHALSIPLPQDNILFVDTGVYTWGILDEVATTAAHVGKFHMGLAACDKLLSEPFLPQEQKERVMANRKLYHDTVAKFNEQLVKQQEEVTKKQMEAIVKVKENSNKTTLNIDLNKQPVKL